MLKLTIKEITLMAMLLAILFVQEQMLSFLPNIQLTILLIILYVKSLGWQKGSIIIIVHVIMDAFLMGSFHPLFVLFNILGYLFIPLILSTFGKRCNQAIPMACFGILFAFIYCWLNIIPSIIILQTPLVEYFKMDLLFELLLASSSFLSILWLYKPLYHLLMQIKKTKIKEHKKVSGVK